jgi:hypothetical protein
MFINTCALMKLAHLERKRYEAELYGYKKALYGRQPGSIYFFSFVFVSLERE